MKKLPEWWNNLENSTQKLLIKLGIPAFFIFISIPFITWAIMMPEAPVWLGTMAWIFPVIMFGFGFLSVVSYMIYESIKQNK
jgi:hypothetical protein